LLDEINLIDTCASYIYSGVNCRAVGDDGHGNRSAWVDGTTPSQIIFWLGRGPFGIFTRSRFAHPWFMTRTIVRSSQPFAQGKRIN
jgi:hypothetical protein